MRFMQVMWDTYPSGHVVAYMAPRPWMPITWTLPASFVPSAKIV